MAENTFQSRKRLEFGERVAALSFSISQELRALQQCKVRKTNADLKTDSVNVFAVANRSGGCIRTGWMAISTTRRPILSFPKPLPRFAIKAENINPVLSFPTGSGDENFSIDNDRTGNPLGWQFNFPGNVRGFRKLVG